MKVSSRRWGGTTKGNNVPGSVGGERKEIGRASQKWNGRDTLCKYVDDSKNYSKWGRPKPNKESISRRILREREAEPRLRT